MSHDSERFPPPETPEAFESLCRDLWAEIWGYPSAQKNGRRGQGQSGIDVFGQCAGEWAGVQCKQKNGLLHHRVSAAELEREVEAAATFVPRLSRFVLATTGPRDAHLQEHARVLSDRGVGFSVEVWSWDDIWSELYQREKLFDRVFSDYWPMLWRQRQKNPRQIAPTQLPPGTPHLFGRESDLARLDEVWKDPGTNVISIVAWGGVGKSSLLVKWVSDLAQRDFEGADYFDWSFSNQGTQDHRIASGNVFITKALHFFGDSAKAESAEHPWDKGARLAQLIGQRRTLLVLDGLEPLQHGPESPLEGALKDQGVAALLKGLAARNEGLCVVTTRERVSDLQGMATAAEWSLERLSPEAGLDLLESLEVKGPVDLRRALVTKLKGHALTLQLLGNFLRDVYGGDVRYAERIRIEEADREIRNGHAFRVMEAYERWFEAETVQGSDKGERELALLRLLGLFDRAASGDSLAALRRPPAIEGLTEPLVGRSDSSWRIALRELERRGLISRAEDGSVDTHPLIREYFAERLRLASPASWQLAHGRLFDHLQENTEPFPKSLPALEPLYQAVYHGCQAGRHGEACTKVYYERILQGDQRFSTFNLGALGADLGAVACFFDSRWDRVSPSLTPNLKSWIVHEAGFYLRGLGLLHEAKAPLRSAKDTDIEIGNYLGAAVSATNLSELGLLLGEIPSAIADAEESIFWADRSEVSVQQITCRTALASALLQAGRLLEAFEMCREAEDFQSARRSSLPQLDSLSGLRFSEVLLAEAELAATRGEAGTAEQLESCLDVEQRVGLALTARPDLWPLNKATVHLTLGRALLFRAILSSANELTAKTKETLDISVGALRASGRFDFLPKVLLTRAWLLHWQGDPARASADLDEAQETAQRGSMKLHLADIALTRARLFEDRGALDEAALLVDRYGYGRRRHELAALQQAAKSWRQSATN